MQALATKRPSDGRSLEKKVKELASKPPTIEVMRELVSAMLTEIRLSVPNFESLFSLLPEVEKVHRALVLEVTGALIQTAENIQKGNHEHAFDESLPAKSAEVQALMAELTATLNARAAELRTLGESTNASQQNFDSPSEIADDLRMSETPGKDYVDARLEAVEARMDGRVAAIESKIDGLVNVLDLRFKAGDERMSRIESSMAETTAYVRTLKNTIFGTAIAGVLGVAGLNYTLLSNMVAAFESGKSTAATQAEVRRQAEETAALLKQIQQQMDTSKTKEQSSQK